MLKMLEAVLMVSSAYIGIFSMYILLRFNRRIYTGELSGFVLESSTYRMGLFGRPSTLVDESTEPREISVSLKDLLIQTLSALTWIALAVWLGTRLFAR